MQDVKNMLSPGSVIGDRYILEELLGQGGFGAVYLVRDQQAEHARFALKEICDPNRQEQQHFAFECAVLKRLDHPALPRVYDVFNGDEQDHAYMLMDYIEGPNLEVLRQKQMGKRFPLSEVMTMMAPIIDALTYLHSQVPPIIHRDIKPANIVVPTTSKSSVLVDFGIAKEYYPDATTTTVRRCSPGYGAPEHYGAGTDTRTDIYGLAATFYTLLTGDVPMDALQRIAQLGSQGTDPLVSLHQLEPSLPIFVADALQHAMSLKNSDRFPTIQQFWQALQSSPSELSAASCLTLQSISSHLSATIESSSAATVEGAPLLIQATRAKKQIILSILIILLALIIGSGSGLLFWEHVASHTGTHAALGSNLRASSTSATSSVLPSSKAYPYISGNYKGSITSISTALNQRMNMTLSVQQNQGQSAIIGNMSTASSLVGSGPFSGIVDTNKHISFTIQQYGALTPIRFQGLVASDGSLAGTYCNVDTTNNCIPSTNNGGIWNVTQSSINGEVGTPVSTQGHYHKKHVKHPK